ncbi:DUF4190 domain-containing protein [Microcella sp.]|uniref:DUF4190 domain-containing protein n=1 Tax=Microcella sp. TaxID=1913979 RepID=UPI00299F71E8|nr:DUF4190 domain-containing protein [Microcella sp.]MDX2026922.1 DUF4190 domain-containing protein [Microcella sp.]
MDVGQLMGLLFVPVVVVIAIILVRRSRSLREKEYAAWLEKYQASTAQPETDPTVLRTLWTNDLATRDYANREAMYAQSNPELAASAAEGGVSAYAVAQQTRTNTLAVLSFIFSLGGGLLGIVFGHIALSQIKKSGESGRKLAIAGLVIGYGWIGLFLAFLALAYTISSLNGAI